MSNCIGEDRSILVTAFILLADSSVCKCIVALVGIFLLLRYDRAESSIPLVFLFSHVWVVLIL